MTDTANLGLPCIDAAQAQKHVTHNEALRLLDTLVQLAVLDRDLTTPPGSPSEGQRWIVKAGATGFWAGCDNQIAAWQDAAWQFSVPKIGWVAYVVDEGALPAWNGSAWADALTMITALQNLALLGIGTTADSTNPFSAKLNNALWVAKTVAESGTGDLRYKLSKASAANTLSFLLQDNFSGRAEIGLTGDDDVHFKVSPDGSSWVEALIIDKTTGKVALQGFTDAVASRTLLAAAPIDALAFNGLQLNGAMEVDQEHGGSTTTLTATGTTQFKYLVDNVMAAYRGSFVAAAQQVASPFAGGAKALKFTIGTAQASLGANDELTIVLPFEGSRVSRLALGTASAANQSLGFWFQAHRTGTYSGAIKNTNVGGASARSYPFNFTISSADTPQWISLSKVAGADHSIPGDTTGTWGVGSDAGMYVAITLAAGSSRVGTANTWAGSDYSGSSGTTNGVAATSDVFYISNIISLPGLELPDSTRAAFVMRPCGQEFALCQRYWESTYDPGEPPGATDTGGMDELSIQTSTATMVVGLKGYSFKVTKRVPPAVTTYSPNTGASGKVWDIGGGADVASIVASAGLNGLRWGASIGANVTLAIAVHLVMDARMQ